MSIKLDKHGISIDEESWHAANPRAGGIEVFFTDSPRVYLDRAFLERALDLIKWVETRGR